MKWIERKFSFEFPVTMFPNILERVRGMPARLEDLLKNVNPVILTRSDAGSWSIQQHAGHLLDLEPLGLQRLNDYEAGRESLTAADMTNRKTYEADHNAKSIESILSSFRQERQVFVQRLEGYDHTLLERMALHPRLQKKIRVVDLAFFVAEHDDHHLVRISELINM